MHEPTITVVGNVAGPARQRTTATGVPVADFRIAATPRRRDASSGQWSDGETLWFGVTAWRGLGEHCVASLKKGDRVVVSGRLSTRSWETDTGERRSALDVEAAYVGLELTRGTAAYVRPAPLDAGSDPWGHEGPVDRRTGAVLGSAGQEGDEADEADDLDGEEGDEELAGALHGTPSGAPVGAPAAAPAAA